jgi:predicted ATPase/tRNA A-37 threonylcarbamoyl transferase component Bud32
MDERLSTPDPAVSAQNDSPSLSPGAQFGRYNILAPLGAGGMGEVYRARDCRLGRELAIKILSRKLSAGKQDLARFEREACSASGLNHPNIVTIFELGQVDSTYYIAMELVDGELLRDMINAGPIPLQKAIHLAAQIADGLAKAHEANIVHRDLKPENLMVSRDGFVKILDFGLAKLINPDVNERHGADTLGDSQTFPGTVLGTAAYMSPEQASGLPLDFRSDQFSFGSVLYEMVTGKRSFHRTSQGETTAAILRDDPEPVSSLNPRAPAPLCWVIERCLAKNPADRYASTRDLARDIANIRERLAEAPSRHSPPRLSNFPSQRTRFIGRDRELASVKELLLRDDVRLITLTGPGGIGKTRLGLEVASELAQNFPSGVCFIPLAAVSDSALIPSIIAQTLGIKEASRQVTIESLKEYLHDLRSSLLLFFDNFEHMLSAAPAIAELITIARNLKILVTSRARLHIYGEHEFPVPSLALPDLRSSMSVPALAKNPTIALFLERAVAVKPNFELTEENANAVATICTRLDGLPLAIELAAARIKLLSPSAMLARLESRLQLLTGGAKDLPLRQQTLRGAIDWSYGLLSQAEQRLFRRVSVFVGGCTLEGVEAVCNTKQDLELDVLEGMESLVDKSLIQHIEGLEGESRFVLLDTVREYALEGLTASGEEGPIRRAHAAYCLVLAEEFASHTADPVRTERVSTFEVDHDNFRAALEWLTHTGDADWGLRLGAALFQFWDMREQLTEGRDRLGKLLKLEGAAVRSNTRARALFAAGVLAGEQGDYLAAHARIGESLDIARELNDARGVAIGLNALAVISRDRGDLTAARSLFDESLAVWRSLGDPMVVARSLSNLANVVKLQGNFAFARSLYEESRSIFRELKDGTGMAWSLNYEGDVAHEQGEEEVAHTLYEQSLNIFRQLDDKWGIAGCLVDLGNLARDHGDDQTSRSHYSESMKLFQELGQKRGMARLLDCLACSAALRSKPERALRLAGAAAAMRQVLGAPLPLAEQTRLEKTLDLARQAVSPTLASAAWLDGWTTAADKAIQDALEWQ